MKLSGIFWRIVSVGAFCDCWCSLAASNNQLTTRSVNPYGKADQIHLSKGYRIVGIPQYVRKRARSTKHSPSANTDDESTDEVQLPNEEANKRYPKFPSTRTSQPHRTEITKNHDEHPAARIKRQKYRKSPLLRKLAKLTAQAQRTRRPKHTSTKTTKSPNDVVADSVLSNLSATVRDRGTGNPVSNVPDTILARSEHLLTVDSSSTDKSVYLSDPASVDGSVVQLYSVSLDSSTSTDGNVSTVESTFTDNNATGAIDVTPMDAITSTDNGVFIEPSTTTEGSTTTKPHTTAPYDYDYYFYPYYGENYTYFEEYYDNGNVSYYNGTDYPDDYYEYDYLGDYYENENPDVDAYETYDPENAYYYYYMDYDKRSRKLKPNSVHKL